MLERVVGELVTRTSLIIGMFGEPGTDNCHVDEHEPHPATRSARGDGAGGEALMLEHLAHIEAGLEVSSPKSGDIDLVRLFSS